MISSLNPSSQQFLNNLSQINQQMQQAETQLSTGLSVNQASDAPGKIPSILEAQASLSSTTQINTDIAQTNTEVNSGEQAMESAVSLFDQVQTLGTEGDTSTSTASSNAELSRQVGSILQQMVGLANTQMGGRYIFAGDSDQVEPYSIDMTQNPPVVSSYQGSATTRVAQSPDGSTFPVALTAQTIFDSSDASSNAFSSIQNLATALNNNDTAGVQTAVAGLSNVSAYLNQQLAFYGTTQQTVQNATTYGQTLQTQLQTQVGTLEDADSAAAIEQMTEAQTQDQAALQSEALMPRTTLFNFLG
jgi:flagellar hook-associated protein 3 FlgL